MLFYNQRKDMHALTLVNLSYTLYLKRDFSPRRPDYLIVKNTDLVHFSSTLYTFNKPVEGKKGEGNKG